MNRIRASILPNLDSVDPVDQLRSVRVDQANQIENVRRAIRHKLGLDEKGNKIVGQEPPV